MGLGLNVAGLSLLTDNEQDRGLVVGMPTGLMKIGFDFGTWFSLSASLTFLLEEHKGSLINPIKLAGALKEIPESAISLVSSSKKPSSLLPFE